MKKKFIHYKDNDPINLDLVGTFWIKPTNKICFSCCAMAANETRELWFDVIWKFEDKEETQNVFSHLKKSFSEEITIDKSFE